MWSNLQVTADLVTFTAEILNGKLHFLCSVKSIKQQKILINFLSGIYLAISNKKTLREKCPNTEFYSGLYFPVFVLNTNIYSVNLRIQSKYGEIRTRKYSVFGIFSRNISFTSSINGNIKILYFDLNILEICFRGLLLHVNFA